METVSYVELRTIIERLNARNVPVPFSLVVCTANRAKNTGGEFLKIDAAVKHSNLRRKARTIPIKHHQANQNLLGIKDPQHWKNQTTNLAILARNELSQKLEWTGQQVKIHFRSIIFINAKRVIH
jgi:hypothetical protein